MKIMTINTHSYIEENSEEKLKIFTDAISRLKPDIIAMQEVNQKTSSEPFIDDGKLVLNQFGMPLKEDNYALRAAKNLAEKGSFYKLLWLGMKRAYDSYEEGLCFLCKKNVLSSCAFRISKCVSDNWRKRMVLGIEVNKEWFYNVHMGRWDDNEDPFYDQWLCLNEKAAHGTPRWLMGDFNAPSDYENEGYGTILSGGWHDTFMLAKEKDGGATVFEKIDGWKDKTSFENKRIDYIFTDTKREIEYSYTVFNGKNEKRVSDHSAVLISYEGNDINA